jgi:hypothetical protein
MLALRPSGAAGTAYTDSDTVLLDLDASGTDTYTPGAPPQHVCASADNAAGSWTTTPLWSKLSDASDATVVTETAA